MPKKYASIKTIIIRQIIICNILVLVISIGFISILGYNFMVNEFGKARLENLRQVNDNIAFYRHSVVNVMDHLYQNIDEKIIQNNKLNTISSEEEGNEFYIILDTIQDSLDIMESDCMIDIIMANEAIYTNHEDDSKRVNFLKKSLWYINIANGSNDESWNFSMLDPDDTETYLLSYGKTLYNNDGEIVGSILIHITQEVLVQNYLNLLNDHNTIFIIDENGIMVSHSNQALIGFSLYDMKNIEQYLPFNTYRIQQTYKGYSLIINYHDYASGWTVVEEVGIVSVIGNYDDIIFIGLVIVSIIILLSLFLSYIIMKREISPIVTLTNIMGSIKDGEFQKVEIESKGREINILLDSYNKMMIRIKDLIERIKYEEKEKRKIEFDFLQAQIDPHFINNTLLTLKYLILLGETKKSEYMIENFSSLLQMPMIMDKQFITLRQEIELVLHYLAIMEYRFDQGVIFRQQISEELQNAPIPRMILQPIVGNSIFHGFADREGDNRISIQADRKGNVLYVYIEDNGEGITKEKMDKLWEPNPSNQGDHHGIGLKNVDKRLKLLYGEESGLFIESESGKGTIVTIKIINYDTLAKEIMFRMR